MRTENRHSLGVARGQQLARPQARDREGARREVDARRLKHCLSCTKALRVSWSTSSWAEWQSVACPRAGALLVRLTGIFNADAYCAYAQSAGQICDNH